MTGTIGVFLASESLEVLNNIKYIDYILDPTFPSPIETVLDRESKFALYNSGWGGFTIKVKIRYLDDSSSMQEYRLVLARDNWPKKSPPNVFSTSRDGLVYNALIQEGSRWRKSETIAKVTGLPSSEVLATLDSLELQNLVRKSPFRSIDNKDMWGSTAIVGCAPQFID